MHPGLADLVAVYDPHIWGARTQSVRDSNLQGSQNRVKYGSAKYDPAYLLITPGA